jgi:hypothetical protein
VPVWTRRALREIRDRQGWKNRELAAWLGIPGRASRVGTWLTE